MFGVFTFILTHFLAKTIFSRGYGGVQNSSYFTPVKKWKFRGGGGLREIPSVVGVWIHVFSGTTHYEFGTKFTFWIYQKSLALSHVCLYSLTK